MMVVQNHEVMAVQSLFQKCDEGLLDGGCLMSRQDGHELPGAKHRASGRGLDGAQDGGPSRAMRRSQHGNATGADGGEQMVRRHPLRGYQFVPVFNGNEALPTGGDACRSTKVSMIPLR
jgi:hypothetical protein